MEVNGDQSFISRITFSPIQMKILLILLVICGSFSLAEIQDEHGVDVMLGSHSQNELGSINYTVSSADRFIQSADFASGNTDAPNADATAATVLLPAHEITSSCKAFIDAYGVAAANYTHCAIHFARPIHFCQNCVTQYLEAVDIFNRIMNGRTLDDKKQECGDMILNSDRIHIIVQTSDFIEKLWTDGKCNNCYLQEDGSVSYGSMSNETFHFLTLANHTTECFQHFEMPNGTIWNTSLVCENCSAAYQELNEFYNHLEEKYPGTVCMDIVDSMNQTRMRWSRQLKCLQPKASLLAVLLLSGFFSLLPIVFYVSNKVLGTKQAKQIVRQKRLRDVTSSLNDTSQAQPVSGVEQ